MWSAAFLSKQRVETGKTPKIAQSKTDPGTPKIRVNDNPGLTAEHLSTPIISSKLSAILNLPKFHVKVFKLYQLGMTTKQIADQLNSGTGPVHNVIKNYKENPEKITACDSINI